MKAMMHKKAEMSIVCLDDKEQGLIWASAEHAPPSN